VLEVFADDRVVAGQYGSGDFVLINNKIGIGTSNPVNKLSVIGAASIGSSTYNTSAPSNGLIVEGNVGIGTTSPSDPLAIYRASDPHMRINGGGNYSYIQLDDGTSYGYLIKNVSAGAGNGALAGALYTYTDSNKAFQHIHAGTPLFTILAVGNVGINNTAPTTKLDVVGSFRVVGTTNVGGIFITGTSATQGNIRPAVGVGSVLISDDSGLSANGLTIPDGGGAIISSESATYDMLTLQIGGTTKHSFNKDGNVGIGATNPNTARLHIKGDTNNPVIRVETALIESPAGGTAGRTLKGWLPIMTGANVGDKVYIPLFGPYI
jgi:hypothetical protein